MQLTPDDFKRAKLIKPGWYPFLVKEMVTELNSKKDAENIVLDMECAEKESEFFGVPVKHWLSEKGAAMPGGAVSFAVALDPKLDQAKAVNFDFSIGKGKYIYAKIKQDRGREGNDPPRNVIEDWAPLPSKYAELIEHNNGASVGAASGVAGFGT
jgi:hypothetical protein